MVSSTGPVAAGAPARASTIRSNLAFCSTFSTEGSASSGPSAAIASSGSICGPTSRSCRSGT